VGEPVVVVGALSNKGMGVISKAGSDIRSVKDLKGKRVGIWPGSTQEVFIMERLRMEGLSIKDVTAVRVPFGEMPAMLARGDVDAYVGAEPAAGISLANGTGRLVEYPYSTPIGPLNMILSASEKAVKDNPARVKLIVDMHRQAVDYAMAHPGEIVEMGAMSSIYHDPRHPSSFPRCGAGSSASAAFSGRPSAIRAARRSRSRCSSACCCRAWAG